MECFQENPRRRSVSIIVPAYQEAENLPVLIEELESVTKKENLHAELIIVDDNSDDETSTIIRDLDKDWVRLIVRKNERGLSTAVLEGVQHAHHEFVVVMDADLSHPPASIPILLDSLDRGNEVVVGSRYVKGASTDESWGILRWLNSKIATILARPFTTVKDPMSGFFAFRKSLLDQARYLNPIGYKVLLEILVKCYAKKIEEVPIHFADRSRGKSKLSLKQQALYITHLRRLFIYKYAESSYLYQFLLVGFSGVFVNLSFLTILLQFGVQRKIAVMSGIGVSMFSNFLLNRRFTFSYARFEPFLKQFLGFLSACSLGAVVNYHTTLFLIGLSAVCYTYPQVGALGGVIAGTGINYLINRFCVFSKK